MPIRPASGRSVCPAWNSPACRWAGVYNIEMDPHEDHNVAALFGWVADPALAGVAAYERSVKEQLFGRYHLCLVGANVRQGKGSGWSGLRFDIVRNLGSPAQ
jgi:hypothetical protein